MSNEIIIVDTDIIINYVRQTSLVLLKKLKLHALGKLKLVVSTITVFEFYSGGTNEIEEKMEDSDLLFSQFFRQPVTDEIAKLAASLNRKFHLYGKIGASDLLIAATSIYLGGKLLTANKRHFKLIPGLNLA